MHPGLLSAGRGAGSSRYFKESPSPKKSTPRRQVQVDQEELAELKSTCQELTHSNQALKEALATSQAALQQELAETRAELHAAQQALAQSVQKNIDTLCQAMTSFVRAATQNTQQPWAFTSAFAQQLAEGSLAENGDEAPPVSPMRGASTAGISPISDAQTAEETLGTPPATIAQPRRPSSVRRQLLEKNLPPSMHGTPTGTPRHPIGEISFFSSPQATSTPQVVEKLNTSLEWDKSHWALLGTPTGKNDTPRHLLSQDISAEQLELDQSEDESAGDYDTSDSPLPSFMKTFDSWDYRPADDAETLNKQPTFPKESDKALG